MAQSHFLSTFYQGGTIMTTDLRTQFQNYMTLQRFADHTQRTYVTGVKGLAKYYKQSPDTLTNEQIQD